MNPAAARKLQLLLDAAGKRFKSRFATGQFEAALAAAVEATRLAPRIAAPWADAAACCIKLERWDEAIAHAQRTVGLDPRNIAAHDALAHAYGVRQDWEAVRHAGLAALQLRQASVAGIAPPARPPVPQPPPPSPATRDRNLIAFSLFGARAKYCECAVLNGLERARLYPHWTCRFYVDDSVPAAVLERLRASGCEIVAVDAPRAKHWPGAMWRFLACDTPGLHRAIFRDADSVISLREAQAVDEWVASDRLFHLLRDAPSHAELILAGLWGVVGGALPPVTPLIDAFLRRKGIDAHFADQLFLRESVWPIARHSLLQHDSVFGFLDPRPFPGGPTPGPYEQVGCAEATPRFTVTTELPESTAVEWTLERIDGRDGQQLVTPVCTYAATVRGGAVSDHLPHRYAMELQRGEMQVRVRARD